MQSVQLLLQLNPKPQRQGKDLLESLVELLLVFLVMLLWVSLKNLEKKQQIPYKVILVYMTRVIGNDVPVDKLGEVFTRS